MSLSPCIEWLFADTHPDFCDRIRAAKAAGFDLVEFHLWRDKPLEEIRRTLDETGVKLSSMVVEPRRSLVDPAQHEELFAAIRDTLAAAKRVGAPAVVIASGFTRADVSDQEHHEAAVTALRQAAKLAEEAGLMLLLEPLNSRVDHPGMYLVSTSQALDMLDEVDSPNLKLLYDKYHSSVMDEVTEEVLKGRMARIGHVQVADKPGRHEPGSGAIDWESFMSTLEAFGYSGPIGLEYKPSGPTEETLARTHEALRA